MSIKTLQRHTEKILKNLSFEKLKVATDFLEYLEEKEENDATLEILKDSNLMEKIKKGKEDIKKGKWVKFDRVKRNV